MERKGIALCRVGIRTVDLHECGPALWILGDRRRQAKVVRPWSTGTTSFTRGPLGTEYIDLWCRMGSKRHLLVVIIERLGRAIEARAMDSCHPYYPQGSSRRGSSATLVELQGFPRSRLGDWHGV